MKHIILFGAGKSSTYLIDYLAAQLVANDWRLTVLDADVHAAEEKTANAPNTFAAYINVADDEQRRKWIAESDIVISLLPPALHYLVALDCLHFSRNLLTASYVDDQIRRLHTSVAEKGLLFLCECGLDPGIDHMSAMKILDALRKKQAKVVSFLSHCGGLVPPGSDNNPWRYKITWNPRNVVMAGKNGAVFRYDGEDKQMPYEELFDASRVVDAGDLGQLSWYPNRDSLSYIPIYQLQETKHFIRTTLRYPEFCFGWKNVVELKLTDEEVVYNTDGMTLQHFFQLHMQKHRFSEWIQRQLTSRFMQTKVLLEKLEELLNAEGEITDDQLQELQEFMMVDEYGMLMDVNLEDVKTKAAATVAGQMHEANLSMKQLFFLGMDDNETLINKGMCSAADVLQFALEKKLALQPRDRDMVVMIHEIGYEVEGNSGQIRSTLVVEGEDSLRTAMAKTVGLPLGIATRLMLQDKIGLRGVHIPAVSELYEPILAELEQYGVKFEEKHF